MKLLIPMKNPKTGEIKHIKVGFSWTLLIFSGFLGIPLFIRKLYIWGGVFLILWLIFMTATDPITQGVIGIPFFIMQIWIGVKGNEMTAKNYLESGWEFVEPENEFTKSAKQRWGITV